jgi:hypothetical protein
MDSFYGKSKENGINKNRGSYFHSLRPTVTVFGEVCYVRQAVTSRPPLCNVSSAWATKNREPQPYIHTFCCSASSFSFHDSFGRRASVLSHLYTQHCPGRLRAPWCVPAFTSFYPLSAALRSHLQLPGIHIDHRCADVFYFVELRSELCAI